MDIKEGLCFCCNTNRVVDVKPDFLQNVFKIFFDVFHYKNISLAFCPVCYHKINLALKIAKESTQKIQSFKRSSCCLCKSRESIIKIKNWQYFLQIADDFMQNNVEEEFFICLNCIFYMDVRSFLKEQLLLKYPELINNHQTTVKAHNTKKQRGNNINLTCLHTFKPLKSDNRLRKNKIVLDDPKLFAQIPYTLLDVSNIEKNNLEQVKSTPRSAPNNFFKIKLKQTSKKISPNIPKNPKISIKPKKVLTKSNSSSSLIIKITRLEHSSMIKFMSEDKEHEICDSESNEIVNREEENSNLEFNISDKEEICNDSIENCNETTESEHLESENASNSNVEANDIENNCDKSNGFGDHDEDNLFSLSLSSDTETEKISSDKSINDDSQEIKNSSHVTNEEINEDEQNEDPSLSKSNEETVTNNDTDHLSLIEKDTPQDEVQNSEENNGNESESAKTLLEVNDPEENEEFLEKIKEIDNDKPTDTNDTNSLNDSNQKETDNSQEKTDNSQEKTDNETSLISTEDGSLKRKRNEDNESDTGGSPDKKKKRVTFSDDV